MATKRISIMLTRLHGTFAGLVYWCTGRRYTHASLRLDEMGESFYSFNFRGLSVEKPSFFHPKRVVSSVLYQIEIPAELYDRLEEQLRFHLEHRRRYHYSALGVCLCLLRIPHHFDDAFFCSRFVAQLLTQAGVIELHRPVSTCHPTALERSLRRSHGLRRVIREPHHYLA